MQRLSMCVYILSISLIFVNNCHWHCWPNRFKLFPFIVSPLLMNAVRAALSWILYPHFQVPWTTTNVSQLEIHDIRSQILFKFAVNERFQTQAKAAHVQLELLSGLWGKLSHQVCVRQCVCVCRKMCVCLALWCIDISQETTTHNIQIAKRTHTYILNFKSYSSNFVTICSGNEKSNRRKSQEM